MSKGLMMKKYTFEFTLHEFKPRFFFYAKLLYTNKKGKKKEPRITV